MKSARLAAMLLCCAALASPGAIASPAAADQKKVESKKEKVVDCEMRFNLKGWSAFYKTSKGSGTITCDNGQRATVTIKATGGGITFGKSEIVDGTGKFSESTGIDELMGSYVQSEAHAGVVKSASAQALTKGEVSLAIAGTGRGVDFGFAFGKFTIQRAK